MRGARLGSSDVAMKKLKITAWIVFYAVVSWCAIWGSFRFSSNSSAPSTVQKISTTRAPPARLKNLPEVCSKNYTGKKFSSYSTCIPGYCCPDKDKCILTFVPTTRAPPVDKDVVHVIFSIDGPKYTDHLAVVINSILTFSTHPVSFHIVTDDKKESGIFKLRDCYAWPETLRSMDFVEYKASSFLTKYLKDMGKRERMYKYRFHTGNFARFDFYRLLPHVDRAIYLDVDLIVKKDIGILWNETRYMNTTIAAAKRNKKMDFFVKNTTLFKFQERYNKTLDDKGMAFNAGVFVVNLKKWREDVDRLNKDILYWLKENLASKLWHLGTQVIMQLVFYSDWTPIDEKYNLWGMSTRILKYSSIQEAHILHWASTRKPWSRGTRYRKCWIPFLIDKCSGQGVCSEKSKDSYHCSCNKTTTGSHCEMRKSSNSTLRKGS